MRIYGLLEDLMGCGYHRVYAPLTELAKHDHDVRISHQPPPYPHEWDILQCQKFTMPQLMPMLEAIHRQGRPKIVMDLDDDLFSVPEHNPASRFYLDKEISTNLRRALTIADCVTVTNTYLANLAKQFNNNVAILPNYIPDHLPRKPKWSKFALGWQGGFSHRYDLSQVSYSINLFLSDMRQNIRIIGQDYSHLFVRSTYSPWKHYDQFFAEIQKRISVGIAPVTTETFNLGKSDIKLKEYAAAGALPIYSQLPPYHDTEVYGIPILKTREWYYRLIDLYSDETELNAHIERAYRSVIPAHTHGANYHTRETIYRALL